MMRSLLLVVLEVTTAISLESTTGEGVAIVEVGSGPKRNGGGRAAPVLPEVNDVIKVKTQRSFFPMFLDAGADGKRRKR